MAEYRGVTIGSAATRQTGPDEWELLDIAVAPECRRKGAGRQILSEALRQVHGSMFLEVRESNAGAMELYESFGFKAVGRRKEYYNNPTEDGIVMRLQKC